MGVVDLDTRRGTWLILPAAGGSTAEASDEGPSRADAEPVQGGLATIVDAGEGQDATLTVYALP